MHILIKNNYLTFKHYRIKCAIGKRGIGNKKKEGDFITPKGLFKIKYILFRKDRVKNLKTCLKKITITKKLGWCDDIRSKKYNQLIKFPSKYNAEKLYRVDKVYDIVVILNYNMNPTVKDKGSAIFIHISKKNYKSTEGCVAVKKFELIKIIKNLKKNSKVNII